MATIFDLFFKLCDRCSYTSMTLNSIKMKCKFSIIIIFFTFSIECALMDDLTIQNAELYTIEGKVYSPDSIVGSANVGNWQVHTRILANGGEFLGFLKEDGGFVISNVPSGSYLVEAVNPDFAYEPVRVEITAKGKVRARKVNHIQTSQVIQMAYPLKMKPIIKFRYFQIREQWRATDFLFSPMVLMMILALVLIMILPKMMNDPETRREMEHFNNSMKYDMPEVSEIITMYFSGAEKPKTKPVKVPKKKLQWKL